MQPEEGARVGEGWTLAIDVGSSNTAAAHTSPRGGEVVPVALTHAGNLLPSAVHVSAEGELLVGAGAANRADADLEGFVAYPKRAVGGRGPLVHGREVPAEELLAAVLRTAYAAACRAHGGQAP